MQIHRAALVAAVRPLQARCEPISCIVFLISISLIRNISNRPQLGYFPEAK
jgi:hypothetical protein